LHKLNQKVVLTELLLLKLERISTTKDILNQKRFLFLTQKLLELTLHSMLKLNQKVELTELLLLKLERISTTKDILNQKRFLFLTQKLLELTPHSTLKLIQKLKKKNSHLILDLIIKLELNLLNRDIQSQKRILFLIQNNLEFILVSMLK